MCFYKVSNASGFQPIERFLVLAGLGSSYLLDQKSLLAHHKLGLFQYHELDRFSSSYLSN